MLGKKLAIDLGADRIRLVVRGEGLLLDEPAAIVRTGRRGVVIGSGAVAAVAADPNLTLQRPLEVMAVLDSAGLAALLQQVVSRAIGRQRIFKPDAIVAVAGGMGSAHRRMVLDGLAASGVRTSYLIDLPMAAAVGAGLVVTGQQPHLVLHLGTCLTEVALIAHEGQICRRSLAQGTDQLRDRIRQHLIGLQGVDVTTAEADEVMRTVASALPSPGRERTFTREDGIQVRALAPQLLAVVENHLRPVVNLAREVIAEAPSELVDRAFQAGMTITGPGAHLHALDRNLADCLGMPARIAADPELCPVRGASAAADSLDMLKRNFMYIR